MRTITLSAGLSLYDVRSAFPIGDLELYIKKLPMISGEFRLIGFMNKVKIGEFTLARDHNIITIPRKSLAAGIFSCYVSLYVNDTEVRRYNVENLVITDLKSSLSAMPEIELINGKISALTKKTEALDKAVTELTTKLDEQANKIAAIIKESAESNAALLKLFKWAYEAENAIPYFDGCTAEEFANKLGLNLLPEEIAVIGGNNEQQA